MIELSLSFQLPTPWSQQEFRMNHAGPINYLVGPNGSGKSKFAFALLQHLREKHGSVRMLSTERLRGMEQSRTLEQRVIGDVFKTGFSKSHFDSLRIAGDEGCGIDTIVLLEERMDLLIQIEATLSQLFGRNVVLEWDSGNLLARVHKRDGGADYRMDRDECHGIKELLILLTHLYNADNDFLIVDEPELNLHPQYQAFFMHEVRRHAGDPDQDSSKKVVFLITHSPFIVDIRSENDLRSVMSFDLDHSLPRRIDSAHIGSSHHSLSVGRLNANHKQFFFCDRPIFVEGIHDAQIVTALMEARGSSVEAAGSCVIDAGGAEEVSYYLTLCNKLGKAAYFLYDLDSLFRGGLRSCIRDDKTIQGFLLSAGLGDDLAKYVGQLERKVKELIDHILSECGSDELDGLRTYIRGLGKRDDWTSNEWRKARPAVMTAVSRHRKDAIAVSEELVRDVEGRIARIVEGLRRRNIFLLSGGTIERYLPCYAGDEYEMNESAKRRAVESELEVLAGGLQESELEERYGELYDIVCRLPCKEDVDETPVIRDHLADYIHELQKAANSCPEWTVEDMRQHLGRRQPSLSKVFSLDSYCREAGQKFRGVVEIAEMSRKERRAVVVDEHTNAGMGGFEIVSVDREESGS